jgi:hypothetical protein
MKPTAGTLYLLTVSLLVVPPGKTESLDMWFDLTDDVKQTFFRQPAELRVHYRSRDRDETAHAAVIGGHLDTSAP